MRTSLSYGLLIGLVVVAGDTFSQQAPLEQSATISTPGKAATMQKVTTSALITDIDESARVLTLKDSQGREFRVVAGSEVRNFDRLKANDAVKVVLVRSLSLALTQAGATEDISEHYVEEHAPAAAAPGRLTAHRLEAVAEVTAVDQAAKTITLKGPAGRFVELDVENPDHFKVVKVGSRVHVQYTETVALSVEPSGTATPRQ
ncbi:MAG TPA: hypothetical protein VLC91_01495 [Spongiibacteraceae bacterium]|nr:hypothetical protein [Spongiibacteraceae bacterium]